MLYNFITPHLGVISYLLVIHLWMGGILCSYAFFWCLNVFCLMMVMKNNRINWTHSVLVSFFVWLQFLVILKLHYIFKEYINYLYHVVSHGVVPSSSVFMCRQNSILTMKKFVFLLKLFKFLPHKLTSSQVSTWHIIKE